MSITTFTPPFTNGEEASASKFMESLQALQNQGAGVLSLLETDFNELLVEFDRRQKSINSRRTLAWRVNSSMQALKFVVSDFSDIDQANTTGTVRADSAAVSLKERAVPAEAVIKTNKFSSSIGTIQSLDAAQSILTVTTDGTAPTGQFDIELVTPLTLNQFFIEIVPSPSTPTIVVQVSGDGLTYSPATQVAVNGYNVTVWLPSIETRFIRIQITPTHPDVLNGNTFTFGITHFSAQATEYYLRSDFISKTLQFSPKSEYIVLNATKDSRILYYLSVYPDGDTPTPFVEVHSGEQIAIGQAFSGDITTSTGAPNLITTIPEDVYRSTLVVEENGARIKLADGLLPSDSRAAYLQHEYVTLVPSSPGYNLELLNASGSYTAPRTFSVSYVYGPSLVNVQLKVRLSTADSASTPVFHGASLDEV